VRNQATYNANPAILGGEALRAFLANAEELLDEVEYIAKAAGITLAPKHVSPGKKLTLKRAL
jgi:hypothetical protein